MDLDGIRPQTGVEHVDSNERECRLTGAAVAAYEDALLEPHVVLWIDGQDQNIAWDSPELQPGQCTAPNDGYIHDIPGQTEGRHKFEVFADPPGPYGGWTSNEIDVGPPESQ